VRGKDGEKDRERERERERERGEVEKEKTVMHTRGGCNVWRRRLLHNRKRGYGAE